MQSKLLHDNAGQRTFAVVLNTGDEAMSCLQAFTVGQRIFAAQFTAIGALRDVVVLKYFDWETKDYLKSRISEQVEVASLIRDFAMSPSGEPALHVHRIIEKRDGSAMAGHFGEAHVRPAPEVILTESPKHLWKSHGSRVGACAHKDGQMK
jgi:hypothetical protein